MSLKADNLNLFESVYAHGLHFEDLFCTINPLTAFKSYVGIMYKRLKSEKFVFMPQVIQKNRVFLKQDFNFIHPVISPAREITVPGVSKLELSEKIHYQKDYSDSGVVLFE